jgi:L-ascorbate metabolism protein UlaG (beta-lactamase superfamily)
LVLDPYVSRPGVVATVARRLVPDAALIRKLLPQANEVVVGHAHYDHVLDAPELCAQTGARLIGSESTMMVARAAGLPEHQLCSVAGGEMIACGSWTVCGLPSRHGKVFGRIPMPGDILTPPPWPPRITDLRHGLVLNWLVQASGLTVGHIDSADFIDDALRGQRCDVLCLCAIGRRYRRHYTRDAIALLKPRWVIPCHWDTMLTPIEDEPELIPTVDLPGFMQEIRAAGATPLLMPLLGKLRWSPV